MRSLERRFNNIAKANPYWSSYTCFAEAVKNQNFSKRAVSKHFNILVEKEDYVRQEKRQILKHLNLLSSNSKRIAEDCTFWG